MTTKIVLTKINRNLLALTKFRFALIIVAASYRQFVTILSINKTKEEMDAVRPSFDLWEKISVLPPTPL